MLQVKDAVKVYESGGERLVALNHVSVDFPDKGMVFLLGKSGSGKSTLLNISGGLDSPDEGEIIVKGKSSKDFAPSDFDSYRNTYIGFIFQEYNILNEFTVSENIALALELQGKPKDSARIEELLEQVDLKGLGDRKPNTLSGGQKQRVAIARALVKNPEIIMGDEPTGALDSATGKQVFDTLKKLSKDKLVVIVSHDREFAELYADRIIELKDGNIISDMTRGEGVPVEIKNVTEIGDKQLAVASGAKMSDEEVEKVVAFLRKNKGSFLISAEEEDVKRIPEAPKAERFEPTTETKGTKYTKDESNFIRSRFPLRHAVHMGLASVKLKPVRLIFTVLLSVVAFVVFGVFSTVVTFDEAKVGATALYDSPIQTLVLEKSALAHMDQHKGEGEYFVPISVGVHYSEREIKELEKSYPAMNFVPTFNMDSNFGITFRGANCNLSEISATTDSEYAYWNQFNRFSAFAEAKYVEGNSGFTMIEGRLPKSTTEVTLTKAVYEAFSHSGYRSNGQITPVHTYSDMIGKEITLDLSANKLVYLTVVGIVDTCDDFTSFESLKNQKTNTMTDDKYVGLGETYLNSLASLCIVSDDFHEVNYSLLTDERNTLEFQIESLKKFGDLDRSQWRFVSWFVSCDYEEEAEGLYYNKLYAPMTDRNATIWSALSVRGAKEGDISYKLPYAVLNVVEDNGEALRSIMPVLGVVAGVLAVFSALLLFNFISVSINAKKRDIGILRAVGARGVDVFKVFTAEVLAIIVPCFVLGCLGSLLACSIANTVLVENGLFVFSVFLFDWLNALMIFAIAAVTGVVSTVVPVSLAVKKKPVETIRGL